MGKMKLRDLSPKVRTASKGLALGKPSAPIPTAAGFMIMMVCGRDAARSTLPTREAMKAQLTNAKLSLMARRYMRDLRAAALIEMK